MNIPTQTIYVGPWPRVQSIAEKGEIDGIVGIYKNVNREKYLDFILVPLIKNKAVVYVKKGDPFQFKSWDSLKGRTLGILIGDRYMERFELFLSSHRKEIKVERIKTIRQLFLMLASGRIDTVIYSNFVGDLVIKEAGLADKIEMLQPEVYSAEFFFAISRKSSFIKDRSNIEKQLKATIAKNHIESLVKKNAEEYLKIRGGKAP
ncbi:substrate-binding periplasmic protein [Bdellovibrio sp. HCB288]|uniref:substrate-binding periplasmic protein n=1 Tax=Bdellovibrio sp. HCB288 TaxID=3394355 RepID=UPI0039B57516